MHKQGSKIDFSDQDIFVGFDVHLKSWKVTVVTQHSTMKTFSQDPDANVLHNYLQRNFPGGRYHSAYEAGFCGYWIHNKLLSLGIKSIVVNPADIPTTNKEIVQKEDKRDSRKIARSLRNGDLTPIYVPTDKTLGDRALIRLRSSMVKDLTRYKNRIKSFLYFHGVKTPESFSSAQSHWSNRYLLWLESVQLANESETKTLAALLQEVRHLRSSVLDLTRQITKLSKTEPYKQQCLLLQSIPGIGTLTAMTLLTELETVMRFKNVDKLCSFIGIVPSTSSSGEQEKTGSITPRGHSVLRSAIVESSWIAIKHDPALLKSYLDYCKRMESNKAIIRIARKMLSRIRFVLKNNQPYVCSISK